MQIVRQVVNMKTIVWYRGYINKFGDLKILCEPKNTFKNELNFLKPLKTLSFIFYRDKDINWNLLISLAQEIIESRRSSRVHITSAINQVWHNT